MNRKEYNYNIHNLIEIQILLKKNCRLFELLNQDFSYFQVEEERNPDITINIGNFAPSIDDCYTIDHRYYIKENYLYCKDMDGRVKWDVEIFGFEKGKTEVNFNFNSIFCLPVYIFLLEGLISYKLLLKKYYLIHAAGISKEGKAILFAGRGGAFKTSVVMQLLRKGFSYLGDDKVILSENNKVLNFPENLNRFNFLYNYLEYEKYNNFFDKMKLMKYIIANKRIDKSNIVNCSNLDKLFFIVKKNQKEFKIRKTNKTVDRMVESNKLELSLHGTHLPKIIKISNHFYRYMLAYSFIFPKNRMNNYFNELSEGLKNILKDEVYEMEVPHEINSDTISMIYKVLTFDLFPSGSISRASIA